MKFREVKTVLEYVQYRPGWIIVSPFYDTWAEAYEQAWLMVLDMELAKSNKLLRGGWPT